MNITLTITPLDAFPRTRRVMAGSLYASPDGSIAIPVRRLFLIPGVWECDAGDGAAWIAQAKNLCYIGEL